MFGHKKGSGFLSQGGRGPIGPQWFNLVPSQGFSGNGMATIGTDNSFSVIAHLPPAHTISPHAPAVYAAYLVDAKGKNGFYAGTLKPAGNGVYQANFRSPVPLTHFNKVVVSLENPQGISQAPQGPIVMKVKEGLLDGFGPAKEKGSEVWGKVKGFFNDRFSRGEVVQEDYPEQTFETQQPPVQQPPVQQYSGQQYYQQTQQYPQQGGYGGYAPQQQRFGPQTNQRLFGAGRPYQGQYPYGQTQPQPVPTQTYTQPMTQTPPAPAAPPPAPQQVSPTPEQVLAPHVQDSLSQPELQTSLEVISDK